MSLTFFQPLLRFKKLKASEESEWKLAALTDVLVKRKTEREREGERFTHIDLTLCSFSWYQLHRNFPHTKLLRYSIMDQTKCGSSFEWNNCNQFMHENLRCVAVRSTLNKQKKRGGGAGGVITLTNWNSNFKSAPKQMDSTWNVWNGDMYACIHVYTICGNQLHRCKLNESFQERKKENIFIQVFSNFFFFMYHEIKIHLDGLYCKYGNTYTHINLYMVHFFCTYAVYY